MWILTTGPTVSVPWSSQSFPSERTAGVPSRSITVTNKSNSLTFSVASSLVCTSPLAVITVEGFFEILMVCNAAELRSLYRHTCSRICHKLSFLRFYGGCGRHNPLIGKRIECSFVLLFELVFFFWQFPTHLRGHIALVFQSLIEICPQIS